MCAALIRAQWGHNISEVTFKFLQFPKKQSNQTMWKLQLVVENDVLVKTSKNIIEKDKICHWNDTNPY